MTEDAGDGQNRVIHVPNLLRAKVGTGDGIDSSQLRAAKDAIVGLTAAYLDRVGEDLDRIESLTAAVADGADDAARADAVQSIYTIVHELRGEAGTFGYPLASKVGNMLCRYIDALPAPGAADPRIVRHHCDSLRAIVKHDIQGDGGDVGQSLLKDLTALVQRLSK